MQLWGDGGLYAAWCDYLDRWSTATRALDQHPPPLRPEDFESSTWERLLTRIQDAVSSRLDRWSATLVRSTSAAADAFTFGRALIQAREGLRLILALTELEELPELLANELRKQIAQVITSAQQQLLDQAQRAERLDVGGSSGAGLQLGQIRSNPLTAVLTERTLGADASPSPAQAPTPGGRRGRTIIFD